jgi:hypothetical protein
MTTTTTDEIAAYRAQLVTHRRRVKDNYARLRDLATHLHKLDLVRYSREKHAYENRIAFATRRVTFKERDTVAKFLQLQRNIEQQAMLCIELEWTLDHEEQQQQEGTNEQTTTGA